ncbi:hypothetical protein SCLCIDRAFT_1210131 [Scleroderma citrinum Foug A]|uniref:DUF1682-domain-containing protein n=1 Tax=Scleroderma citrinum Foug A TaxID=1036808 RepID=A0A0C3EJ72_9AGAM|nr:hypothetical protein SCLCIDRAFT_1210131 [Scleroderma citrinum Foug A]
MASALLTPPPIVLADHYDGLEYRWKFLVFRPAVLQVQAFLLLALLVYIAFSLYGKALNERKAAAFYAAVLPLFTRQFSQPSPPSGLISDGPSDFFVFSTGRRAIASLHTALTLLPRQDPLQLIWQYAWSAYDLRYEPFDVLTFDFTLDADAAAAIPDCIWAVARKSELTSIRNSRWDLTFTRTTDHPSLGPALAVLSEFADVTDVFFKLAIPHTSVCFPGLIASTLPYLRVFSITDQPDERPSVSTLTTKSKRVVLTFNLPEDVDSILPLLEGTFALVDLLATGRVTFRSDTRAKIKKVREDVEKEIKGEASKEKKEEAAEDKRAARRKAEEERIAKLSPSEQKKNIERERKRAIKKSQGKLVRKA